MIAASIIILTGLYLVAVVVIAEITISRIEKILKGVL